MESYPHVDIVKKAIILCLNDLKSESYKRKSYSEINLTVTPRRVEKYIELNKKLVELGVHHPDDKIILDAHDYNVNNEFNLDFITFDIDCYNGVSKIDEFSFNSIKNHFDYF